MKPIVVTGATGFIGGRLVEHLLLEQQAELRVLVRDYRRAVRLGRFHLPLPRIALSDAAAVMQVVDGCGVIYHLAHDFTGDQLTTNLTALHNLAKAALQHKARLVYTSSVEVYGWPNQAVLDESTPYHPSHPDNLYAQSKLILEKTLLEYHQQHGLEVVILQPTIVYGPYGGPWTLAIADALTSGQQVGLLNSGAGICNPVYVDDVVQALLLAATSPHANGQRLLISGPDAITWHDFYTAFESALGVQAAIPIHSSEVQSPVPSWVKRLLRRFLDPMKLKALRRFSIFNQAYLTTRFIIPRGLWLWLQSQVKGTNTPLGDPTPLQRFEQLLQTSEKPIILPFPAQLPLYQNRAIVSSHKAQQLLGYQPQYRFEQGMIPTKAFLNWPTP